MNLASLRRPRRVRVSSLETVAPAWANLGPVPSRIIVDGKRKCLGEYLVDPHLLININRIT